MVSKVLKNVEMIRSVPKATEVNRIMPKRTEDAEGRLIQLTMLAREARRIQDASFLNKWFRQRRRRDSDRNIWGCQ